MKRRAFILVLSILIATTHRLAAPIQEVPESPTPAPEQSVKPKPKPISKPKVTSERSDSSTKGKTTSRQLKSEVPPNRNPFAGTWTGTINQGILGTPQVTLVINGDATSVTDSSNLEAAATHGAKINGNTLQWHTGWGWLKGLTWTLTPNPDGQTALVTSKPMVGVNASATFSRTQGSDARTR